MSHRATLALFQDSSGLDRQQAAARRNRRDIAEAQIGIPYAARDSLGDVAHVQWTMGPEDNSALADRRGRRFLALAADELFLTGGYTFESHRDLGVFAEATSRIAQAAVLHRPRTRWVLLELSAGRERALRAAMQAGFEPYLTSTTVRRFGRVRTTWTPTGDELHL